MTRSFQASMLIHHPDVIFILGKVTPWQRKCGKLQEAYRFKTCGIEQKCSVQLVFHLN